MAILKDGSAADELGIINEAAKFVLYDASGNPMFIAPNSPLGNGKLLPNGFLNDGIVRAGRADRSGALALAYHNPLIFEAFDGATINGAAWVGANTNFAPTQSVAGYNFNPTSVLTASSVAVFSSLKRVLKTQKTLIFDKKRVLVNKVQNTVAEWGLADAVSGLTQISNGAYFQKTTAGTIIPVWAYNGVESVTGVDFSANIDITKYYTYDIVIDDDSVTFVVQDANEVIVSEQTLKIGASQAKMFQASHLLAFGRLYNTAVAPSQAGILIMGDNYTYSDDINMNKPWGHVLASMGKGMIYSPTAFSQLANYANTIAPASITLSNSAAGYTTLGGQWQFANLAGAETDYNLFEFTVPSPYQLVITGIRISAFNMGAANSATVPTLLQWGLGVNGTTSNLNTGGYSRLTLGSHRLPVSAAIGDIFDKDIVHSFSTPVIVEAGRRLSTILKVVVGAATASQIIRGNLMIEGYFE